ncbi:MAG TPA: hypothetical protein VHO48_14085, partial [Anaerolineaceae bacterium]|nr:hypothetical protein [Anaerolineaceae bacterium]
MHGSQANTLKVNPAAPETAVSTHALHHHFSDLEQQRESSTLGMWVFLVTEILFFGGMFTAYLVYRTSFPQAFISGSQHMEFWAGTANTLILLTSSLTMVLAVHAAQTGERKTYIVA